MNKGSWARHRSITIMILCLTAIFVVGTQGFAQMIEIEPLPPPVWEGPIKVTVSNVSTEIWYLQEGSAETPIEPGVTYNTSITWDVEASFGNFKVYSVWLSGSFGLCKYEVTQSGQGSWSHDSYLESGTGPCPVSVIQRNGSLFIGNPVVILPFE